MILVGHSLGPAFILNVLEKLKRKVDACFFVSGFVGKISNPGFDKLTETFMKKFDWNKVRKTCDKFYVLHSDNDPYVPLASGRELAEKLGAEFIVVHNAGHFNEAAGYTKFPLLLEKIKEVL